MRRTALFARGRCGVETIDVQLVLRTSTHGAGSDRRGWACAAGSRLTVVARDNDEGEAEIALSPSNGAPSRCAWR